MLGGLTARSTRQYGSNPKESTSQTQGSNSLVGGPTSSVPATSNQIQTHPCTRSQDHSDIPSTSLVSPKSSRGAFQGPGFAPDYVPGATSYSTTRVSERISGRISGRTSMEGLSLELPSPKFVFKIFHPIGTSRRKRVEIVLNERPNKRPRREMRTPNECVLCSFTIVHIGFSNNQSG